MSDSNDITSQVASNYWANRAVNEADARRDEHNRNLSNSIGNAQNISRLEDELAQLEISKNKQIVEKNNQIVERNNQLIESNKKIVEGNKKIVEGSNKIVALSNQIIDLALETEQLTLELCKYKALLSKPFAEIASACPEFKPEYEKQHQLLATWMVSQKAFKEVAYGFGALLGKTKEEVIALASGEATQKVLANNTVYDNNGIDSTIITSNIEFLKKKFPA
jgi:sulfur carrier protein ThiS